MLAVAHFDGGCRPRNPGHAAFASVIELDGEQYVIARYIGWHTNNYAEYNGCVVAIKYAHSLGADSILLKTDSQLVERQLMGKYKIRQSELKPLYSEAIKLLGNLFPNAWAIEWAKRATNHVADGYCTSALNAGRNRNPFTPQKIKDKRPGTEIDPFKSKRMSMHTSALY